MAEDIYRSGFRKSLKLIAPGTPLRLGIENVLQANTGGLIVVGDSPQLVKLISGGFFINCEFSPARLYELAKMDGAIVIASDLSRILFANAQLDPDPGIETSETGLRHRTAERVAIQTGELVISISERRKLVTLYQERASYRLRDIASILIKANQALQTLEKYRNVLGREIQRLGMLEFEDMVTAAEVCEVLRRSIRVLKVADEIENYIVELGSEGRLVKMQLEEMIAQVFEEAVLIIRDYSMAADKAPVELMNNMMTVYIEDIPDPLFISKILNYGSNAYLDQHISPRGYRMLKKLPRIPQAIIENLIRHFDLLREVLKASIAELDEVEGIGEVRARSIKNGLKRMHENLLSEYSI